MEPAIDSLLELRPGKRTRRDAVVFGIESPNGWTPVVISPELTARGGVVEIHCTLGDCRGIARWRIVRACADARMGHRKVEGGHCCFCKHNVYRRHGMKALARAGVLSDPLRPSFNLSVV